MGASAGLLGAGSAVVVLASEEGQVNAAIDRGAEYLWKTIEEDRTKKRYALGERREHSIMSLALIHAEVTMSDAYVDTPGREDGQWIEDARPRAQISERWFGDTRLRRLAIRTLAEGQALELRSSKP